MPPHLNPNISYFARTDFRGSNTLFGIYQHDRMLSMYLLGKTGSGKTNLMKTLIYQDIIRGRGLCLLDVHGDLYQDVKKLVPEHRKADVVELDPTGENLQWGYNPLRKVSSKKRALLASHILETFKKLWGNQAWGIRLEYILRNVLLTLLDQPKGSFEDVPKILLDEDYRKKCLDNIQSPALKRFWIHEFAKHTKADILPVLNKVGSFLSIPALHNILVKNEKQLSLRKIMDEEKILIVNLSKGALGSDGAHLLGSLLLTSISSAALSRTDIPEQSRKRFFVFLDEFHNYTTFSLTGMLSELRKFGLGFILAHQYLHQLSVDMRNAVLGNVGTIVCFKLGQADARYMASEFHPVFEPSDFVNLEHYHIYLKLLINGKSHDAFSGRTITIQDFKTPQKFRTKGIMSEYPSGQLHK